MHAHHAYYMEGSTAKFDALASAIPHFVAQKFERLGIDEARALTSRATLKTLGGEAVFLIAAASITSEAQQALLKLFEEPQRGVVFILLVPHGSLLPTLRSRMLEYPQQTLSKSPRISRLATPSSRSSRGPDFSQEFAAHFLQSTQKSRSDAIATLLKDEDNAKERMRDFLDALEAALAPKIKDPAVRAGLGDIAKVRSYVGDRSPALKMLLEHLALSLPQL